MCDVMIALFDISCNLVFEACDDFCEGAGKSKGSACRSDYCGCMCEDPICGILLAIFLLALLAFSSELDEEQHRGT